MTNQIPDSETQFYLPAAVALGATLAMLCEAPQLAGPACPPPEASSDVLIDLAFEAVIQEVGLALHGGRFRVARLLSDAAWTLAHARRYREAGDHSGAHWAVERARALSYQIEALESGNVPGAESEIPVLGAALAA